MKQSFYIESIFLGEITRTKEFVHAELVNPLSGIWFCGYCGEVYAKAPLLLPSGRQARWQSYRGCCKLCRDKCTNFFEVPGSIWLGWYTEFVEALPDAVLRQEVLLHINWYEGKS